jgi:hypothetical protein
MGSDRGWWNKRRRRRLCRFCYFRRLHLFLLIIARPAIPAGSQNFPSLDGDLLSHMDDSGNFLIREMQVLFVPPSLVVSIRACLIPGWEWATGIQTYSPGARILRQPALSGTLDSSCSHYGTIGAFAERSTSGYHGIHLVSDCSHQPEVPYVPGTFKSVFKVSSV